MAEPKSKPEPQSEPPAEPPAQPTIAQLTEIAEAATNAAKEATDAAQAAKDAGDAAQKKAGELGFEIPEEAINQIAEASSAATIANLEQRGAFRGEEPPPSEPPTGDGGEGGEGGEGGSDQEPPPEPERKKTAAERYLGY